MYGEVLDDLFDFPLKKHMEYLRNQTEYMRMMSRILNLDAFKLHQPSNGEIINIGEARYNCA